MFKQLALAALTLAATASPALSNENRVMDPSEMRQFCEYIADTIPQHMLESSGSEDIFSKCISEWRVHEIRSVASQVHVMKQCDKIAEHMATHSSEGYTRDQFYTVCAEDMDPFKRTQFYNILTDNADARRATYINRHGERVMFDNSPMD